MPALEPRAYMRAGQHPLLAEIGLSDPTTGRRLWGWNRRFYSSGSSRANDVLYRLL